MEQLQIIECEQGTEEWHQARCGIITASQFKDALPNSRGYGKGRQTMIYKIAAERIRGESGDIFESVYTERGKREEPEICALYEDIQEVIVQPCGFMRLGMIGYSPDGLVGSDGLIEIKSKAPHIHLSVLMDDEMPDEHKPQVQGGLMISGREWCDFISYCRNLPLFIKRVYRDEEYISKLREELDKFNQEVEATINEIMRKAA